MEGLHIKEHANKYTKDCSGGTNRKLSYAMAMLGNPKIVLLDEPSTGMDPMSKRFAVNYLLHFFWPDGTTSFIHSLTLLLFTSQFRYYPMDGFGQHVFVTDIQLPEELPKLDYALREIRGQTDIINTFEAWYFDFEDYYNNNVRELESENNLQSEASAR